MPHIPELLCAKLSLCFVGDVFGTGFPDTESRMPYTFFQKAENAVFFVKPAVLFRRVLQTKTVSGQALENQRVYM